MGGRFGVKAARLQAFCFQLAQEPAVHSAEGGEHWGARRSADLTPMHAPEFASFYEDAGLTMQRWAEAVPAGGRGTG